MINRYLRTIRHDLRSAIKTLEEIKSLRKVQINFAEEDDVVDNIDYSIRNIEIACFDLSCAFKAFEWEQMTPPEREEYIRHGITQSYINV